VPGVEVETDLGTWQVIETPGHAPSHICLHQPDRRMLLSGDHLLGRVSLYFDVGWTPDPVGEFMTSLDAIDAVDARLALSGHGRPFTDVRGHVNANRALLADLLGAVRGVLAEELTAFEIAPRVFGDAFGAATGAWLFTETMALLGHLEERGEARRIEDGAGGVEIWGVA
jgi:glyoxylase-like metal-dependent hydrolase (beta-lactamase superfamily II)